MITKKAVLTKRLEEMSPEERESLLAEVEAEKKLSQNVSEINELDG